MGKKHKNKQELVKHVAKETGIDPKELDRMDTQAIEQVDGLTDDDLLGGDTTATQPNQESDLGTELGSETTPEEGTAAGSAQGETSGTDGIQEGRNDGGSDDLQPSGMEGGQPPHNESGSDVGHGLPVGEVDMEQVQVEPSETPKSPDEVAKPERQGNSHDHVSHGKDSGAVVKERVLLGTHPVTGAKVYLDEQ